MIKVKQEIFNVEKVLDEDLQFWEKPWCNQKDDTVCFYSCVAGGGG